ncbi:radial spoke head protein 9 homolog [Toxorhynchites rutilus septentrionalis]|uniref:radial spoke head protein 9 homolog n=1 Tax=Toxorhynchites rutilus septentrionalis TaxID=329112 RepID=UPI00247867E4|nr:radial spoke head protein 9 homolog [Toxorhynchites rutilus septentrionalis]
MNLDHLRDHLPYTTYAFRTFSAEEKMKLEITLRVLQHDQQLVIVYFLGKLEGADADYYLAFGCSSRDVFRCRKLFYSQDLSDWFLLQEPKEWHTDWDKIQTPFRGDPAFREVVDLGPEFTLDEDLVPVEGERKRFAVNEQDRLWFVVTKVLEEAAIVPRGVLYHNTEGESVINPFFGGLSVKDSVKLQNYHHFRKPFYGVQENLLKRDDCSYFLDVFDTIDDLIPKEASFAITQNIDRDVLVLKPLHWPGMINFHRAKTAIYGFLYFGDGRKNWDLLFMI